jgi:uncharacterized protein (TIGR03435 family)
MKLGLQKECQRQIGELRLIAMRLISGLTMVFLAAGAALGQTPDARPAFEAAFIKANTTGSGSSSSNGTKGQVVMVNQSLRRLIERGYNVKPFQVIAPEWTENVCFDITAKYPEDTKNSDRPAMLKTLLEDRFKLTTHPESKELPGYALVLAKGGLKIKPVEPDKENNGTSSHSSNTGVSLKVTAVSMEDLADYLARRVGSKVIDSTGVTGVYTFELHWTLDASGGPAAGAAAEFAAIQEAFGSLGLRLQAQKVPVQMVVVDHVERVPTEN